MKKYLACIFIIFVSLSVTAQDWEKDYAGALLRAEQADRPLILVFAGPDWCAPCIKLDREIWRSETFKAHAREHCVLYRADFPRKKAIRLSEEKNEAKRQLANRFNPKGHFPLVVVLNAREQVLSTMAYQKIPPENYISQLNSFIS